MDMIATSLDIARSLRVLGFIFSGLLYRRWVSLLERRTRGREIDESGRLALKCHAELRAVLPSNAEAKEFPAACAGRFVPAQLLGAEASLPQLGAPDKLVRRAPHSIRQAFAMRPLRSLITLIASSVTAYPNKSLKAAVQAGNTKAGAPKRNDQK